MANCKECGEQISEHRKREKDCLCNVCEDVGKTINGG